MKTKYSTYKIANMLPNSVSNWNFLNCNCYHFLLNVKPHSFSRKWRYKITSIKKHWGYYYCLKYPIKTQEAALTANTLVKKGSSKCYL